MRLRRQSGLLRGQRQQSLAATAAAPAAAPAASRTTVAAFDDFNQPATTRRASMVLTQADTQLLDAPARLCNKFSMKSDTRSGALGVGIKSGNRIKSGNWIKDGSHGGPVNLDG